jgi:multiple sugar transport system permease protein
MAALSTTRRAPARLLGRSGGYLILLAGLLFTLVPFVYVILTSLKPPSEIIRVPPSFLPQQWTFQNYERIFTDPKVPLARFYGNSLFVAVSRVLLTLFTSSLAGYVFAKYRFAGKTAMFGFVLMQLMIPFQMVMIPSYLILVRLGLVDTLWGLVIPSMVDAFGIFLMRQFIEQVPGELLDAGRIDGASELGIYWRIVLPQLGAPLATLGIFTFMATWNDYLWPLIVITTHENRTLPLLLTWYSTQHGSRPGLTMAASVLVLLPVLLAYIFFQRWIIGSVTQTGFK